MNMTGGGGLVAAAPGTTQMVAQKRIVSKIGTISCDNSETVRDRM